MAKVEIKDEKILSDEHYVLKRIEFEVEKKDGKKEVQQREVYDHGNAVAALLYNVEKKTILLTRQFRLPTFVNGNADGILTEVCAGLLEKGEAPEEAMLREIEEEMGYRLESVDKAFDVYSSAGALTEMIYLFTAAYSSNQKVGAGGGLEAEGEELTVLELPFAEALGLLSRGEIKDAKTIILLQYVQAKQWLA